jgi:dethiobiotin synthetase
MCNIIVTGCGTGVGKTIVSAIIAKAVGGDYFKPIACGPEKSSDTNRVKKLLTGTNCHVFPSAYSLQAALSPHHAARLENISINVDQITLPTTSKPLIIETAGGILVPLHKNRLTIDLFSSWQALWIVVSKNYLGSINHTLLTLEALKQRKIDVSFLIFNGPENQDSQEAILHFSQIELLGTLQQEKSFSKKIIEKYANLWKEKLVRAQAS